MRDTTLYKIAIAGMSEGEHQYNYQIEDSFFEDYELSPVKTGSFEVDLILIKKSNHLELVFEIGGLERTTCDRCLADISLPIGGSQQLIVKYDDDEREVDDVVYISYNSQSIDISKYIYEFICLNVPATKLYDCEDDIDANCNMEVLDKLDNVFVEKEEDEKPNPFAESLKNLKL